APLPRPRAAAAAGPGWSFPQRPTAGGLRDDHSIGRVTSVDQSSKRWFTASLHSIECSRPPPPPPMIPSNSEVGRRPSAVSKSRWTGGRSHVYRLFAFLARCKSFLLLHCGNGRHRVVP